MDLTLLDNKQVVKLMFNVILYRDASLPEIKNNWKRLNDKQITREELVNELRSSDERKKLENNPEKKELLARVDLALKMGKNLI